jgi:hypothetical protein
VGAGVDLVVDEGLVVEHLFHDGRLAEHSPTPQARRVDDHLHYPRDEAAP